MATWWAAHVVANVALALRSLIITVLAAFIVSSALELPVAWLTAHRLRRGVATALVLAGLVVSLMTMGVVVGALVARQITHLLTHAPDVAASLTRSVDRLTHATVNPHDVAQRVRELVPAGSGHASSPWLHRSLSTIGQFGNVLTALFVTFYLTAEGPQIREHVCRRLPADSQAEVMRAWELAVDKTSAYFIARLLLAGLRAVILATMLLSLGVPYWLALAIWFGVVAEFIPVIGTALGVALPVAVALGTSPTAAFVVLVGLTLVTQVRNLVLAPRLSRRAVNVHPAIAFIAVIAAARLVGPAGTLVAIPVVATAQAFISTYVKRHDLAVTSNLLDPPSV